MPRDMSYRKPVPEYIPSPPSSPLTSGSEWHTSQDIPPLPIEWRETIERALSLSNSTASTLKSCGSEYPDVQLKRRNSANPSSVIKSPGLVRRESAWSAAHCSHEEKRERQLHHIYRPPTPPLPKRRPKRRKTEVDHEQWDSCSTLAKVGSAAMQLQNSRSTGQTLVATESPMMVVAGSSESWTNMLKKMCGQLATKLEKGMKWLRC